MQDIVPNLGQHPAQHFGVRPAGVFGRRQLLQEGRDLRPAGKAHVGVVGFVGAAGRRGEFLGIAHLRSHQAGCHQRPASTTPAESSRLVADHALADRIGIVEPAAHLVDHRRLADAADLQRAEVGPLDRGRGVHRRELDAPSAGRRRGRGTSTWSSAGRRPGPRSRSRARPRRSRRAGSRPPACRASCRSRTSRRHGRCRRSRRARGRPGSPRAPCRRRRTGALGKGRKQWVRMSPGRSRLDHLVARRRRRVEMGHHRQAELLGDVERDVERHDAGIAAGRAGRRAP